MASTIRREVLFRSEYVHDSMALIFPPTGTITNMR